MALILHIDTALKKASVGLSENGNLLISRENTIQNSHAGFVQKSIKEILTIINVPAAALDAIGVVAGPGSYTGIRIGMASAKGLCYALEKPLITVSTLVLLANAAAEQVPGLDFYCPMIDARRNEVFTAVYDGSITPIIPPHALILKEDSFGDLLQKKRGIFAGDGAEKFEKIISSKTHTIFKNIIYNSNNISLTLHKSFINSEFSELAYTEPLYLKEFYQSNNTLFSKNN